MTALTSTRPIEILMTGAVSCGDVNAERDRAGGSTADTARGGGVAVRDVTRSVGASTGSPCSMRRADRGVSPAGLCGCSAELMCTGPGTCNCATACTAGAKGWCVPFRPTASSGGALACATGLLAGWLSAELVKCACAVGLPADDASVKNGSSCAASACAAGSASVPAPDGSKREAGRGWTMSARWRLLATRWSR